MGLRRVTQFRIAARWAYPPFFVAFSKARAFSSCIVVVLLRSSVEPQFLQPKLLQHVIVVRRLNCVARHDGGEAHFDGHISLHCPAKRCFDSVQSPIRRFPKFQLSEGFWDVRTDEDADFSPIKVL